MNSKKTMESSVISLKYYAAHLADSSLLRGLLYERIHAKMLAVKERLGGILHSIHSFIFSVISDT